MKKKNTNSTLYFLAGICFFIAAIAGDYITFYPVGLCMIILGITNLNKNSKNK